MNGVTRHPTHGHRSARQAAVAAAPLLIIGSLIYAAFFVKAEVQIDAIHAPAIERRDVFYGLVVPKPGVIWAAGSYGKVVRSNDGGQSWAIQPTRLSAHLQSIAAWDAQRAVAVGNQGRVIVTDDGGASWTEVEVPRSEVANKLVKVRAYADGLAWAVGEMGAALRSTDHGRTWARALPEQDQGWNDVVFVGADGWLVGEFGRVMRSRDGGATWAPAESPSKASLMSVAFRDALNGVAVGLSGTVLTTADGGASWALVPPPTREHLNHVRWDGAEWSAVGDKGVRVSGKDGAWSAGRLAEADLSWRTQGEAADGQLLLAGANLARLGKDGLHVFGRH
jgi:photosystem II stability/assembly factor-like uncharacterized protein